MNGDFTRFPIGRVADSLYPLAQQGRVHLESDWNELAATLTDTMRSSINALLGGSAAIDGGFRPQGPADENLTFAPGTYFVEGYRVQAPHEVSLGSQPWPLASDDADLPAQPADLKNVLFYLDVWVRHVTARSLPDLADVALRGPDTTTRGILTWQVRATRVAQDKAVDVRLSWPSISSAIRPQGVARLQPIVKPAESLEPCLDDLTGGYTGPRNQLYRFEVAPAPAADGAPANRRVVLWSRDNASAESRIRSIGKDGSVALISDPTTPALQPGDLVQLVDDHVELGGIANVPVHVSTAEPDLDLVTIDGLATDISEADAVDRHPRLRHWDGMLELKDGEHEVEHGLWVTLTRAQSALLGEYWVVPARTNGTVLWPDDRRWPHIWPTDWPDDFRPPHGVEHLFAPLALIANGNVLDCRWTVASLRNEGLLSVKPFLSPSGGASSWVDDATGAMFAAAAGTVDAQGEMTVNLPNGVRMVSFRATGTRPSGTLSIELRRQSLGGGGAVSIPATLGVAQEGSFDLQTSVSGAAAIVDVTKYRYFVNAKLTNATAGDTIQLSSFDIWYARE
jgi:hypothetical protein